MSLTDVPSSPQAQRIWSPDLSPTGQGGALEPGRPGGLRREGFGLLGGSQGWEAHIAMATSSSRGNNELPNVQQIGRGPAECQLGLQADAEEVGRWSAERGLGERQSLTSDPQHGRRAASVFL